MKKVFALFAAMIMLFTLSGCPAVNPTKTSTDTTAVISGTGTSGTSAVIVNLVLIENHAFNPNVLTIKIGDSVTWTNKDNVSHSVVFTDFKSGLLAKDESYTHVFDTAGSYDYNCGPHPDMLGTLKVE